MRRRISEGSGVRGRNVRSRDGDGSANKQREMFAVEAAAPAGKVTSRLVEMRLARPVLECWANTRLVEAPWSRRRGSAERLVADTIRDAILTCARKLT